MKTDVLFSSATDQWATPQWLFDELDKEFRFTLDPCADESNHKCQKYYTKTQDGLSQDWGGEIVFCNPPYGRKIGLWVKKCHDEVKTKSCPCAVMLIPARTDTKWFHENVYKKAELRFVKGRIKFGNAKYNAPFPSMIVIFKKEANA
jgi:site-specific DNA-methyltransferase (adenine-specific)